MPVKSMTGFGTGRAILGDGRVVAEIRTLNSRTLDTRMRVPEGFELAAHVAEQGVRTRLRRGRVDVVLRAEGSVGAPPRLDLERAVVAVRGLEALRDRVAPGAEVPLSLLAALPGLFAPAAEGAVEALREAVAAATEQALEGVVATRTAEGATTVRDLEGRLLALGHLRERLAERTRGGPARALERLRARLAALVAEGGLDVGRLEMEAAILADRSDVHEELERLAAHLAHFAEVLAAPDAEGVGRRLDFLLQEIQRETSTLGAKSQDGEIARDVIAMKVEIERMREQVQNVE
jgi:uncharacterized protein (TIGR00255 family)